MMDFVYLDDYICQFIDRKIAEKVRLDIRKDYMAIRSHALRGSTILGVFWIKVLQHSKNFPPSKYTYQNYKDMLLDAEKIILRAEDMVFIVNLTTGALEIQGPSAHTWFKKRFLQILQTYDGLSDLTRGWYSDEDSKKLAQKEIEKARKDTGLVHFKLFDEDLVSDLEKDHLRGLWTGPVLENYMSHVNSCCVRECSTFIYRLWKSLLMRWLSDGDTRVTLATERFDAARLRDCVDISLLRKGTANWESMLVPNLCDPPRQSKTEIQRECLQGLTSKESLWVEYELFQRLRTPDARIHCNWIAGSRLGETEVLVTSCGFHGQVFDLEGAMATVQLLRMSDLMFQHEFVKPLYGKNEGD